MPKLVEANAVPFRAGMLLAKSGNTKEIGQELGQQPVDFGADCQQPLVEHIREQLAENGLLNFESNLLAQFLGRRERICR